MTEHVPERDAQNQPISETLSLWITSLCYQDMFARAATYNGESFGIGEYLRRAVGFTHAHAEMIMNETGLQCIANAECVERTRVSFDDPDSTPKARVTLNMSQRIKDRLTLSAHVYELESAEEYVVYSGYFAYMHSRKTGL